jgi:hypothetical protein
MVDVLVSILTVVTTHSPLEIRYVFFHLLCDLFGGRFTSIAVSGYDIVDDDNHKFANSVLEFLDFFSNSCGVLNG